MIILWRLILAHLLADFTFQTNFIAGWKRRSMLGGLAHSGIFFLCSVVLCFEYLGAEWFALGGHMAINGWTALVVLSFLHFVEDEWRVWTIQKLNSPDSFFFFIWDQFIHFALILVFFPHQIAAPGETWVYFLILFILVTHFTTVFLYFLEKELYGESTTLSAKNKYGVMALRLITSALLLLPGPCGVAGVAAITGRAAFQQSRHRGMRHWVNTGLDNGMALIVGLIGRFVLY